MSFLLTVKNLSSRTKVYRDQHMRSSKNLLCAMYNWNLLFLWTLTKVSWRSTCPVSFYRQRNILLRVLTTIKTDATLPFRNVLFTLPTFFQRTVPIPKPSKLLYCLLPTYASKKACQMKWNLISDIVLVWHTKCLTMYNIPNHSSHEWKGNSQSSWSNRVWC